MMDCKSSDSPHRRSLIKRIRNFRPGIYHHTRFENQFRSPGIYHYARFETASVAPAFTPGWRGKLYLQPPLWRLIWRVFGFLSKFTPSATIKMIKSFCNFVSNSTKHKPNSPAPTWSYSTKWYHPNFHRGQEV